MSRLFPSDITSVDIVISQHVWTSNTDNTYWTMSKGAVWDGTKWTCPSNLTDATAIGTWHIGYRPLKMRVTYTSSNLYDIYLEDQSSNYIVNSPAVPSGAALDITFGSYDLKTIRFYYAGPTYMEITKIEFYY